VKTDIDNLRLNWRDEDGSAQFASPLRTAAAVYIAELEAENGRWKDLYMKAVEGNHPTEHYYQMTAHLREKYRAELAALKAQECEGCEHDIEGVACQCGQGVSVDGDIPSTDFACNRWTARAEEGTT